MIKKYIAYSIIVLSVVNAASSYAQQNRPDPENSQRFKLNAEKLPRDQFKMFAQKIEGENYHFKIFATPEEVEQAIHQNDNRECIYCPRYKTVILDNNDPIVCRDLHAYQLTQDTRKIMESTQNLTKIMQQQAKMAEKLVAENVKLHNYTVAACCIIGLLLGVTLTSPGK